MIIRNSAFRLLTSRTSADYGGLWLEEAYYVKAGTVSSTTSSAVAIVTAPAPTQAGIPATCNVYDITKDSDRCELFTSRNGITVT